MLKIHFLLFIKIELFRIKNNQYVDINLKKINSEFSNMPSQLFSKAYKPNGYIDIMKTSIVNDGMISGDKIYAYVMNKNDTIDIDNQEDWNKAELSFNYFK